MLFYWLELIYAKMRDQDLVSWEVFSLFRPSPLVMAILGCQLDYIWNYLKPQQLVTPVRDFFLTEWLEVASLTSDLNLWGGKAPLIQTFWGRKIYLYLDHTCWQPTQDMEEEVLSLPACCRLASKYIPSLHWSLRIQDSSVYRRPVETSSLVKSLLG